MPRQIPVTSLQAGDVYRYQSASARQYLVVEVGDHIDDTHRGSKIGGQNIRIRDLSRGDTYWTTLSHHMNVTLMERGGQKMSRRRMSQMIYNPGQLAPGMRIRVRHHESEEHVEGTVRSVHQEQGHNPLAGHGQQLWRVVLLFPGGKQDEVYLLPGDPIEYKGSVSSFYMSRARMSRRIPAAELRNGDVFAEMIGPRAGTRYQVRRIDPDNVHEGIHPLKGKKRGMLYLIVTRPASNEPMPLALLRDESVTLFERGGVQMSQRLSRSVGVGELRNGDLISFPRTPEERLRITAIDQNRKEEMTHYGGKDAYLLVRVEYVSGPRSGRSSWLDLFQSDRVILHRRDGRDMSMNCSGKRRKKRRRMDMDEMRMCREGCTVGMRTRRMGISSIRPGDAIVNIPWHRGPDSGEYEIHRVAAVRRGAGEIQLTSETGRRFRFAMGDKANVLDYPYPVVRVGDLKPGDVVRVTDNSRGDSAVGERPMKVRKVENRGAMATITFENGSSITLAVGEIMRRWEG